MLVIKREPIRLYLIKYLFQTGTNSACGFGARKPIRYQPPKHHCDSLEWFTRCSRPGVSIWRPASLFYLARAMFSNYLHQTILKFIVYTLSYRYINYYPLLSIVKYLNVICMFTYSFQTAICTELSVSLYHSCCAVVSVKCIISVYINAN
jgi:hypothetical protein